MADPHALVLRLRDLPLGPAWASFVGADERALDYVFYFLTIGEDERDRLHEEIPFPPDDPPADAPEWNALYQVLGDFCYHPKLRDKLAASDGEDLAVPWAFRIDLSLEVVVAALRRFGFEIIGIAELKRINAADHRLSLDVERLAELRKMLRRDGVTAVIGDFSFEDELGFDTFGVLCRHLRIRPEAANLPSVIADLKDREAFRSSLALALAAHNRDLAAVMRGYLMTGDETVDNIHAPAVDDEQLQSAADAWRTPGWDPTPFAVHADQLLQDGDLRGELAALQALQTTPTAKGRATRFLRRHADIFVGKLGTYRKAARFDWEHGYIFAAQLSSGALDVAHPAEMLDELLSHPSGRFLRWLDVRDCGTPTYYSSLLQTISRHAPVGLTTLYLGIQVPSCEVGNLGRLWRATPRLRSLVVCGKKLRFDNGNGITAPNLAQLTVASALDDDCLGELAGASWPQLTALKLALGEAMASPETLAPLFTAKTAPKLESLTIECANAAELEPELRRSRLRRQLRELKLT